MSAALLLSVGGCGDDAASGGGSGGTGGSAGVGATGGSTETGGTGAAAGAPETGGSGASGGASGSAGTGATAGVAAAAGSGATGAAGTAGASGAGGGSAAATGNAGNGGAGGTSTCTDPVFVTSDPNGGWSDGGYYVHNNMWNSAADLGPETLYACSYDNWYVVSNQTNDAGAVKTYPNVHVDYGDVPISSFNTITSTFAETSPQVGIYNVAYDIWLNGVATTGSNEIMIWTENFHQVPAGDQVDTVTLGEHTYDVWKTADNHYIAFVPAVAFTSGTVDLLEIIVWTAAQGWLPPDTTLGQICFGVEIVSTDGADATYHFTDFSITSD